MAKSPRFLVTLPEDDQKKMRKVLAQLDLKSPGQLLQMLLSGDEKRIDWIADELKRVNLLF